MPMLFILSEEMKGQTFELVGDKVTVGRLPDNTVQLEHDAVSGHHAELIKKGDDYVLRDLNSTNGTRVNGQRILEFRLTHQDIMHFGSLELQYLASSSTALRPLPSPNKKTVDLSAVPKESFMRPASYSSSSPFKVSRGDASKSKTYLQITLIALGVVAICLLTIVLFAIFRTKS